MCMALFVWWLRALVVGGDNICAYYTRLVIILEICFRFSILCADIGLVNMSAACFVVSMYLRAIFMHGKVTVSCFI